MSNSVNIQETAGVRVPPVIVEAPPAERRPRSSKVTVRIWSTFFLAVCGTILAFGVWMHPSARGYGTHSDNLNLPPCGFLMATGMPCPTCGCTTAVTHLAHGNLWMAVKTQPFGAVFGLLCGVLVVMSVIGLIGGRWLWPDPIKLGFYWKRVAIGGTVLLLGAWGYKILAMKMGW